MPVTPSLLAFIFIGIAAAGVLPEIAVRDGTVAGQGGLTLGFSDPPRQTNPPLPSGLIVDAADVLKRTGKHPGFFSLSRRDDSTHALFQASLPVLLTISHRLEIPLVLDPLARRMSSIRLPFIRPIAFCTEPARRALILIRTTTTMTPLPIVLPTPDAA